MYTHGIVGTQGGALLQEHASAPVACSGSKTPRVYRPLVKGDINFLLMLVKYREAFCGVAILLPRMMYTHGIVGTQGGALLQEHASAPVACSGSKTPRVYRPLVKGDINFLLMLVNGQPKLFYDTKK